MDAAAQIEIGQRVDALQVERALVGEGRGGDDVDALGVPRFPELSFSRSCSRSCHPLTLSAPVRQSRLRGERKDERKNHRFRHLDLAVAWDESEQRHVYLNDADLVFTGNESCMSDRVMPEPPTRDRGHGLHGHPGLRQRPQPSLFRAGQQGPDRGVRQRQIGPEFALRISAGVRPRPRGCRPLDQGGPVRAAEERRHHHHRPVDGARRLARRPRLHRHPRRRLPDDAPGRTGSPRTATRSNMPGTRRPARRPSRWR